MSFGFSVSDFVTLGTFACKLDLEFKEAPGACRAFAHELLLFYRILHKLASDVELNLHSLRQSDGYALKACLDSCKELICVKIYGAAYVPACLTWADLRHAVDFEPRFTFYEVGYDHEIVRNHKFLQVCREKWRERKFAARIPKLQQAITAHIQSLTAFTTLLVRSDQVKLFESQDRLEALHEQTQQHLKSTNASVIHSQTRLEAASERLEESQKNMERQIESILAFQKRHEPPILSQSLDASSPEGRETWMNLGRLLRAEGITPSMIKENRDVLVKVMKTTLHEGEWSSTPQSYHTAYESLPTHHRTLTQPSSMRTASLNVLGSAPPRGATFTDDFLDRHHGLARSLDQEVNVDHGMQSLLHSMDTYSQRDEPGGVPDDQFIDLEGLAE